MGPTRGLAGKSIIVTGGGSGIGRGAVELLAQEGCRITIADLNETDSRELAAAISDSRPGQVQFVRTDVSDENSVRSMVAAAVSAYGRLDGAINAAGVPSDGKSLHELDLSNWDFCVNINLRGMFLCMKHEIQAMLKTGGGSIVAVSSVSALIGNINCAEYCASKAGVTGLVRAAAVDYAKRGIRINALLPGATDTPLAHRARETNPQIVGTLPVPLGRMAQPCEIASGAVWMLSDQASYMTGSCMIIDAGMSIA
jgi:NAD(P)-dependent dehydrogenase (short-subunit alcohol dehydrogenase family)